MRIPSKQMLVLLAIIILLIILPLFISLKLNKILPPPTYCYPATNAGEYVENPVKGIP